MSHTNSPAELIQQALVNGGQGAQPNSARKPVWPIFVGHLPSLPDSAACVYDTSGFRDGRIMRTGESIDHQGFQLRIRALHHADGYTKALEILDFLETIKQAAVSIDGDAYTIHSVTKLGTVLSLGEEADARRRVEFTVNCTLTFTKN